MRILLFSSSYAPRAGGLETVTRRLARELADRGHDVLVATNRYPRRLPSWEYIDGIPVHRQLYPGGSRGLFHGTWIRRLKELLALILCPVVLARLALLVLRFRPDVINAHYFSTPTAYVLLVARVLRRPVILSFHGSDLPSVPYPSIGSASFRLASSLPDGYTTCSRDLLGYLQPLLTPVQRSRAVVIHNGIDARPHELSAPRAQKPYVLVPARLVEKKGLGVIIEAVALLRDRKLDVAVVIAGDGPERDKLEHRAAELDVASHVTFLGPVPHEVSRALTNEAILVAIPSHWEAFGMVALEAMAAGKAVVASNSGGVKEIVLDGETGMLVEPGDSEGFAGAIQTLVADPERRKTMGVRGRERALQHFTWSQMVDGYLAAYERVLEATSVSPSRVEPVREQAR